MENVLIIHVDQLRRDVLSCYGGKEVQTPNIDFLAENGVLLENFYTPSAVCTPSRGCFFTGNYPHENGAYRNGIPVKRMHMDLQKRLQKQDIIQDIWENGI